MAGPLAWFRKYQKLLLGFFGVLLMIAFTVSLGTGVDPLVDYIAGGAPGGGPSANEIAVQWTGGKLYESDLQSLRYNRVMLVRILMSVAASARARGAPSTVPAVPLTDAEDSLVQSHLLAAQAKDMGVLVSDDMITDYLKGWGGNSVSTGELASILRYATDGRMTQDQLFGVLRGELLAQNVWLMAQSGLYPTSPVAAWDFFNRLHRLVEAELMAIRVDDFLPQVEEPSDSEMREFYETYKERYPHPDSPEPGFKERRRIAFEIARVDFGQFLDMELPNVTDAEIEAYYEQHKDDYRKTEETSAGEDASDEAGRPGESDLEIAPSDRETEDQEEAGADQPETNQPPSEGPTAADPSTPQSSGPDVPVESEVEPVRDATAPDTAAGSDANSGNDTSETTTSDLPGAGISESDLELQAPSQDASVQSDDPLTDVTGDSDQDQPGQAAAGQTPGAGDSSAQEPAADQPTYMPLEEVREKVRAAIARPRAQKKMVGAINAVRAEVDRYFQDYTYWNFEKQDNPEAPKPAPPDFTSVTDRHQGLTMERTELVDRIQITNYEIGQAYDRRLGGARIAFAEVAFDEDAEPYKARIFPQSEIHDVKFLFWKVDEREALIPELSDIRAEVVRVWKMQPSRALRLALESAEQDAERARQASEKSLTELFADSPGRMFIETDKISWMTTGSLPFDSTGDPWTATPIPGVEDAGDDFREKLFRLESGQVAVAANQPRTIVYVIRMLSETPDQEELRDQFLKGGATFSVQFLAYRENRRVLQQWYRTLLDNMELRWLREPQGPSQDL